MNKTNRILYLSHGGGPLPLLGDENHGEMLQVLQRIANEKLERPSAIIVVSAHWEEPLASITASIDPGLIYDYYGFPEESYQIKYPCTGEPKLATKVQQCLQREGVDCELNQERGFDHGLFVPLKIMYPDADIPCIQVSLLKCLDAREHLELGRALAGLDHEGLLVVGSGFSFHNLRAFFAAPAPESQFKNKEFEAWLIDTLSDKSLSEAERGRRLLEWETAPGARYCHPREEHLLPLHVCYGMAGSACSEYFELSIMNKRASMYLW